MNWKLIFSLSLFGVAMAFAGVCGITGKAEPLIWLAVFVINGIIIFRYAPGNYFLHGFLVSVVNGIWIGIIHASMITTYMANNPEMVEMEKKMPQLGSPQMTMVIFGPIFGAIFGLINGLIAWIISKIMKKKPLTRPGL